MKDTKKKKMIAIALLVAFALLSIFVISKPLSNANTYAKTIQSIDEKKGAVMGLTAGAAAASTALALIPGDTTTPIANQIMQVSSYLLIVVCVLVLEKALLPVMGYLAFTFLIPASCGLFIAYLLANKQILKTLAAKFLVFALIIVTVIPVSLKISDLIYEPNRTSIEELTTEISETETEQEESGNPLKDFLNKITSSVSNAGEQAKQLLNKFIDGIALFLISYCAIPILIVALMLWFVKLLFGITLPTPKIDKIPFVNKKSASEEEKSQTV